MGVSVKVEFNHFDEILAQLLKDVDTQVDKSATDIAHAAQSMAHVRSGGTRASVYVVTPLQNTYGEAAGEASSLSPKTPLLPQEAPEGEHGAVVSAADSASVYEEMGTRNMAAIPFLTPAAEGYSAQYVQNMQGVIDNL